MSSAAGNVLEDQIKRLKPLSPPLEASGIDAMIPLVDPTGQTDQQQVKWKKHLEHHRTLPRHRTPREKPADSTLNPQLVACCRPTTCSSAEYLHHTGFRQGQSARPSFLPSLSRGDRVRASLAASADRQCAQ